MDGRCMPDPQWPRNPTNYARVDVTNHVALKYHIQFGAAKCKVIRKGKGRKSNLKLNGEVLEEVKVFIQQGLKNYWEKGGNNNPWWHMKCSTCKQHEQQQYSVTIELASWLLSNFTVSALSIQWKSRVIMMPKMTKTSGKPFERGIQLKCAYFSLKERICNAKP